MSTRRRFSGEFKAKVALEALRGDKTIQGSPPVVLSRLERHGRTGIRLIPAAFLFKQSGPPQSFRG